MSEANNAISRAINRALEITSGIYSAALISALLAVGCDERQAMEAYYSFQSLKEAEDPPHTIERKARICAGLAARVAGKMPPRKIGEPNMFEEAWAAAKEEWHRREGHTRAG